MITSSVMNYSSCDSNNDNTGHFKYLIANGVAESLDLPYNVLNFLVMVPICNKIYAIAQQRSTVGTKMVKTCNSKVTTVSQTINSL